MTRWLWPLFSALAALATLFATLGRGKRPSADRRLDAERRADKAEVDAEIERLDAERGRRIVEIDRRHQARMSKIQTTDDLERLLEDAVRSRKGDA